MTKTTSFQLNRIKTLLQQDEITTDQYQRYRRLILIQAANIKHELVMINGEPTYIEMYP